MTGFEILVAATVAVGIVGAVLENLRNRKDVLPCAVYGAIGGFILGVVQGLVMTLLGGTV